MRIGKDRGVVGERRHGADLRCGVCDAVKFVEGPGEHFGIGVEQEDVAFRYGVERAIDRFYKAEVLLVREKLQIGFVRETREHPRHALFRRTVVDDNYEIRFLIAVRENAAETLLRNLEPAIDGYDDGQSALRRLRPVRNF